jgi:formamidopyrimidine-DNA glycosylase
MPELPEVETIKNDLRKLILGKKIIRVNITNPKVIREPAPAAFKKSVEGARIKNIFRSGKLLILELSGGKFLTVHLKMTGQLIFCRNDKPKVKSDVKKILLAGGHSGRKDFTPDDLKYVRLQIFF